MEKLTVKGLPSTDAGRLVVRLNHKYRNGIPRYGIAKIRNPLNNCCVLALVLGHDSQDAIYMPYDIRKALGLEKEAQLDFEIKHVGIWGKLKWYFQSPDPAVHLPAWLAMTSVVLAGMGILLAVCA